MTSFLRWVRRFSVLVALLVLSQSAWCLDPAVPLSDYNHRIWTTRDGAPAHVDVIAQTPDGWLWFGGKGGLTRFDGVRFYPYVPPAGSQLLSEQITTLVAESNGDLYIGYSFGGLTVRHADGRLEHLAQKGKKGPSHAILNLLVDTDGSIWTGTTGGLMHYSSGTWTKMDLAQGYDNWTTFILDLDARGRLWVGNNVHMFLFDRDRQRFVDRTQAILDIGRRDHANFRSTVMSPDGRLWMGDEKGLVLLSRESAGGNFKRSHGNQTVYFTQYAFDKDGNLWILRCPSGICLASRANATRNNVIDWKNSITSRLDQPSQLSTLVPSTAFEDSEGNVWIGTAIGVERFRNNVLLPAPPRLDVGYYGMFRDGANMIWIMEWRSEKVMRFDIGKQKLEVLSDFQGALSQAADGAIVSSGKSDIRILRSGQETHVPYPTAVVAGHDEAVIGRAFDDGERIWLLGGDIDYVREGNSWYSATARGYPSTSHYRWVGDRGHFWVGMDDGGLMLFEHGKASRTYSQDDVGNIGTIMDFSWSPELVVTGETGIAVMSRGRFRRITVDVDAHLHQITGFYVAADGTRWLNGKAGLLRVQPDDWRAAVERGVRLRYHLFDALDGYPGIARSFPRDDSLLMVDGKLWIIGSGGIAQIDPRRQERNPVAPEPEILSVMGDGVAYPISGIPVIRPGTTRLRFDFTAPSLRKPERVMFSYRLDGVDSEWQTSSERSATYTELAPGDYRFRVRAMNEDGVRSRAERTLALHVQPTLTQTWWFKAACVMALFLLLWLAHLARLRMATRVLTERLQAQTQERERIARDLHDTVLQTFQSVVLKVKAASLGAGTDSDTRSALENSMRAANEAIEEGRDKVHSLRAAGLGGASLAEYLRALGEREAGGRHFVLRCVGQARPLRPGVEDELGAIGREALCNAFRHAQASEHEVVIAFGRREMSLTVRDNGRGISADDLGKDGHWGLRGIEERALSIHADATLATSPASGTTWEIRLGAALAYSSQRSTVRWLFLRGLST